MTNNVEKPKILIVDDAPSNIKILAEILRDEYQILVAANGKSALKAAISKPVSLILLDVFMPEMDGYEVFRRLKAEQVTAEIPVIFITTNSEISAEYREFELGVTDYIAKPVDPLVLKSRIKGHLESKRQKDTLNELTTVDELTGVAKRHYFDQILEQEWRRAVRGAFGVGIILIEIDYFKQYSDHFGQNRGNECLRKVAGALQATLMRSTDLLARYDEDGFVAVLPQIDYQGVTVTADKLRKSIEGLQIPNPKSNSTDHISISLGFASTIPTKTASSQSLIEAADKMLYAGKRVETIPIE
jgi:diguanylate cyclase (GGDEF)-like protein